jgi:hypothetical protein
LIFREGIECSIISIESAFGIITHNFWIVTDNFIIVTDGFVIITKSLLNGTEILNLYSSFEWRLESAIFSSLAWSNSQTTAPKILITNAHHLVAADVRVSTPLYSGFSEWSVHLNYRWDSGQLSSGRHILSTMTRFVDKLERYHEISVEYKHASICFSYMCLKLVH